MKHLHVLFLVALVCRTAFAVTDAPSVPKATPARESIFAVKPTPTPVVEPGSSRAEIAGLLKLAKKAIETNNVALSEKFYERLLNVRDSEGENSDDLLDEKREGLLEMARMYEKYKLPSKAIAVYEKMTHAFPRDPQLPTFLLSLGRLYRESGAYQLSLDRFYSVLHSVLNVPERELAVYKTFTLTAQFEIAETYFLMGNYEQAGKFFRLIKLLNLSQEDRDRVNFKSLYCQFLLNDYPGTIALAQSFLQEFPDSANMPQTRYILAAALKASKRSREALNQVLVLLRTGKANAPKDPEVWNYWKRKTGNQIANDFYAGGEFVNALTIYQELAKLNNAPDWQWPVIYQMGICFERLRLTARAMEAYQYIVDERKKVADAGSLGSSLISLCEMAEWRIEQLKWQQTTETQVQALLFAPADLPQFAVTPETLNAQEPVPPVDPALAPSASATSTPSVSPTPTATPAPSVSPTPTATPAPSVSPTPIATPAPSVSPTPTATPAPSVSPTPTATPAPSVSPKPKATPASSVSPKPKATPAPSVSAKPKATPAPSVSPKRASAKTSPSPTPTPKPTASPSRR